jgi:hypothetical protein
VQSGQKSHEFGSGTDQKARNLHELSLKGAIQGRGTNVFRTPVEVPAAARARWLAEVAETLEQAELLLNRLKRDEYRVANLGELSIRIEAAKREVELLRRGRQSRTQNDPGWAKLPPWEDNKRSTV